jgi:hypothetical protein
MEVGWQRYQAWLELGLSAPSSRVIGRGWRLSSATDGQWFKQSQLCNENFSIMPLTDGFGGASG